MRRKYGSARDGISEEAAFELGVVYSAVKDELVAFAAKEGSPYSFADVAARVARLLQAEAVREQLRDPEHLSQMRQNGTGHHRGRPPQSQYDELAAAAQVFAGSSSTRPLKRILSAEARERISEAQRRRWARARGPKPTKRDYSAEYWKRKARKQVRIKTDGTPDLRGSPEAKAKQAKRMKKLYRDPVWRKAMLYRLEKMRAAKRKKERESGPHRMSEETKAKLRAARLATVERKRAEGAA